MAASKAGRGRRQITKLGFQMPEKIHPLNKAPIRTTAKYVAFCCGPICCHVLFFFYRFSSDGVTSRCRL